MSLMSAKELEGLVGRKGLWKASIWVDVTIEDARRSYGRVDVQIAPVSGMGMAWVSLDSVLLDGEEFAEEGGAQ